MPPMNTHQLWVISPSAARCFGSNPRARSNAAALALLSTSPKGPTDRHCPGVSAVLRAAGSGRSEGGSSSTSFRGASRANAWFTGTVGGGVTSAAHAP